MGAFNEYQMYDYKLSKQNSIVRKLHISTKL